MSVGRTVQKSVIRDRIAQKRILCALEKGPLYEGAIPLVAGTTPAHARRILRHLHALRLAERDAAGTWRTK